MSWDGIAMARPSTGFRRLFAESIRNRDSAWASEDSGTCTGIWSPSKSALNALQTSGCSLIALPSTRTGSKAWMDRRCRVGARLRSTGWALITFSRASHTSGFTFSTFFFASLMFEALPVSTSRFITKGLKSSRAISFGRPHWKIFSPGPTTMTERPE